MADLRVADSVAAALAQAVGAAVPGGGVVAAPLHDGHPRAAGPRTRPPLPPGRPAARHRLGQLHDVRALLVLAPLEHSPGTGHRGFVSGMPQVTPILVDVPNDASEFLTKSYFFNTE